MDNAQLMLPEDTDNIKTENYLVIEEACKKITEWEITGDEFLSTLEWMEHLLPDIENETYELYRDDGEGTDSEALKSATELYLQGLQSYKEALSELREYLKERRVKHLNNGLSMALEGNKKLVYSQHIIAKKEEQIKESEFFFKQQQMIKRNMATHIFSSFNYGIQPQNKPAVKELVENSRNKREVFSAIPFFDVLSREQIEKISRKIKYKKYEKDTVLFNYGDAASEVYIIKSGEISLYKTLPGNSGINEFATISTGDIFGEMGIISDAPRILSAKVSSDKADLYVISRDDFLYILKTCPEVHLKLSKILCERITENNKRLMEFLSS